MLILFWFLLILASLSFYLGFLRRGNTDPRSQAAFVICSVILLPLTSFMIWQTTNSSQALERHISLYPRAKNTMTVPKSISQDDVILLQYSSDSSAAILAFFQAEAKHKAWQIAEQQANYLRLEKPELSLSLMIAENSSGSERTILYTLQKTAE
jgi:hypothetical protein